MTPLKGRISQHWISTGLKQDCNPTPLVRLLSLTWLSAAVFISACSTPIAPITPPVNFATAEARPPAATGDPTLYPTSSPYPTYTLYPTSTPFPLSTPHRSATISTDGGVFIQLLLREILVDLPQYDRGDWRHWIDADRDCQNTRHEVLDEESLIAPTFKAEDQCQVLSGQWLAPFTGVTVTEASMLDVDHMVPLANAHKSGAWGWDADRKRDYANNLYESSHLIAVTASANRSKGAKGPEEWQPPDKSYRCQYAKNWVLVKSNWSLSVTAAEWIALDDMLGTCDQRLAVELVSESGVGISSYKGNLTTRPVGNQQKWDTFVKERSGGYGSVVGLPALPIVALAPL